MVRALALVPLLLLAGCGGDSSDDEPTVAVDTTNAGRACEGDLVKAADPAAKLPADFPALPDQVLYEPSTQGKTTIVFGRVPRGDFVAVRDELVMGLNKAGWTIDGTDQESVEAEAQFSRQPPLQAGSVKVEPLCKDTVEIRYRLSS